MSGNRAIQDIELKELKRKKKAALEKLKENYLYATMDGVITYVNMEPGMSVSAIGSPLTKDYLVSLCIVCFLQNLQYFFVSILSGWFFFSFVML